ncbi:2-amino-4-hydroxy-6-hydroxymethyldihydropteridine diphosphokinase [Psychrobacter sp.]|uniref:2-amino-4-hydroxy-6- hydroxymethyldihydropteridine diphosphokinase n=1 Tax=Psychrobacter sp. TaxID=56811 RepID=UPI002648A463|nr:2-amino-4-hydroxy-6-hydroxymethyldihydropteridine diphosphokinase [Psychrobacter sp.]MDN6276632.1 2-amino-4-hydroxy-6-hydroxymethyldihydropteridine diphosphokinase [Psychrobacter sp.]MDN6307949.1 2-amino-4-hydroxy-6-hydroxymethyldihydropteridine diphosphokinase [Psychrobacter sp.]
MHKTLAGLTLDALEVCASETLQAQTVTAVVLALGSNYQADKYLPRVRESLAGLGEMQLSTAFQNPDFTATKVQPKPDYTNQCVYLSLNVPMTLQKLEDDFKQFESDCHRQRLTEGDSLIKQVTMDIDILMVKMAISENSLSSKTIDGKKANHSNQWLVLADRYPFKAHEKVGINELDMPCRITANS